MGSIEIGLPKKVILHDFYFEDQAADTLLAGKTLKIDISLFKLLSNKVEINSIDLEEITANISVNKDSVFNFDYIIKAFETNEPKSNDTTAISIKKINLDEIKFTYKDAVSKNDIDVFINHFDTKIDKFNLNDLSFDVPKINLIGFNLVLNQDLVEATKKATKKIEEGAETSIIKLNLKDINLENINISYKDAITNIDTKIQFEKLNTQVKNIDLEKQIIAINSIELNNTNGQFTLTASNKITESTAENTSNASWKIDVNTISITDFNVAFDNNNTAKTSQGIDFNHLELTNLNFNGNSVAIDTDAYSGDIETLSFKEKSGFQLDALKTAFNYNSKGASLKKLYLKTPQTTLQNSVVVTYPSIESISENPENLEVDGTLMDSKLGFKDVLLLIPQLNSNNIFKNNPKAIVNFNAVVKGRVDNLEINTFNASGIGSTQVDVNGTITGLPNIEKTIFNLDIKNFESSSKDIYAFTPKNTIPNSIQLPEKISVKGNFKGGLHAFKTNLNLKSSLGNAIVEATFDQSRKNDETYIADARVENFDLGKFLKNNQLGKVTANASINGRSLDPATATAKLNSKMVTAKFNNYDYKNITLNGNIDKGVYTANASSTDPNLNFILDAEGSSNPEKPTLDLKLNMELVDLNKLNLHADPLKMKGNITANFDDLNPDNLNGTLNANNFLIALEKEQFPLDTISIIAKSSIEKDSIILKSQFANGLITGDYKLSTIADQLTNSISRYYQLNKEYRRNEEDQNLDFEFIIKDNQITKKIISEFTELSEITLNGSYNAVNDSIIVNASIPRLNYANNEISNGVLKVHTQDNALMYDVSFGTIKNTQFEIPKTSIVGKLEDNTVDYELNIKDVKNTERYVISGVFKDSLEASILRLNPEKLLLNYEDWKIDAANYIKVEKGDLLVSNFKIENNQQSFSIQSENNVSNAPINVNFENFKLESLTSIAISNFEVGGTINGEATLKDISSNLLFVADLDIENLRMKNDTIGNTNLKVNNKTSNLYNANVTLSGLNNDLNINGNYSVSAESLDLNVDIQKLQMASLQAFTFNNLKESEGFINGKLNVTGKASNPNIEGNIKFNDVGFLVVPLNSKFNLINDKIVFNTDKIVFEDFKLQDENGNPLKINGTIDSKDYTNLGFNLNVIANNFRAVNSTSKDNDLFYGELYLDNNLGIKGTLDSPIIDGTVKINDATRLTIVLPQSDPSIADREGIVEFIDQDQPVLITVEDPTKQITQTEVKGINASVNIEVDKKAEISIIIDEANGDYLKLQGEAELTGGIDPSGKTTLTGKYEFTGGAYEMNFNLIKRKFEIQPESYILWTGEPTTANISITAVYKVEASPLDLVDDQLVGITTETRNTYKQKIPFETNLIMKGELLQPEITFDIILPDGNNNVSTEVINTTQAKLEQIRTDEDALNKQVFALLLLNRFIGENPFQSEAGGTSGTFLAKQSVSKILSQQLNNLAGDLIKGFELDFDLEATEDYSSGEKQERTDLNVALSKQLLDDRLKVTVGSSFGLEGEGQENEQATNIAGDVTADYLLTKDGRYKIRAYRKNNYQVALQGQVIETGVAFIITMNYDKFRELFHSKRKGNRQNRNKNENENE
ncbi:translocation/assembly module TamB domain-containing protein [Mariniflexile gromovii]|uniref:Translocation/assembly module TamB domain-containing protein n=1 Tax=Mariniflexile gromovii TaxID=362523 RepID=A0ABS4BWL7_9FLAO|nr:translocation/assembly module TamB domain-containing protein [Mariniflexile gromovii]MBP0904988.1 translocation/assembly module TamB domain-containing protein [Mariniflexile gromovii]